METTTMSVNDSIRETVRKQDEFFAEAFTNPVTGEPSTVPEDLKRLSRRICQSYGIKGVCDPMYIANVIAFELGMGDGQGKFTTVVNMGDCVDNVHTSSASLTVEEEYPGVVGDQAEDFCVTKEYGL